MSKYRNRSTHSRDIIFALNMIVKTESQIIHRALNCTSNCPGYANRFRTAWPVFKSIQVSQQGVFIETSPNYFKSLPICLFRIPNLFNPTVCLYSFSIPLDSQLIFTGIIVTLRQVEQITGR